MTAAAVEAAMSSHAEQSGAELPGAEHTLGTDVTPLAGRTIAVARSRDGAASLIDALEALGATVLAAPAIQIVPLPSYDALDDALARVASFQWVAFTSANAVAAVAARLEALGTTLDGVRVAAVGGATADAARRAFGRCDLVPARQTADGLAAALPRPFNTRVLFPGADRARDALPMGLRARGARVTQVTAYCTVIAPDALHEIAARVAAGAVDAILLSSPSGVEALADALGRVSAVPPRLVAIGPATAGSCRDHGFAVAAVAAAPTDDALVAAVCSCFTA